MPTFLALAILFLIYVLDAGSLLASIIFNVGLTFLAANSFRSYFNLSYMPFASSMPSYSTVAATSLLEPLNLKVKSYISRAFSSAVDFLNTNSFLKHEKSIVFSKIFLCISLSSLILCFCRSSW